LVNFIFNPAEKRIITKKKKNRQTNSIKTTHRTKKKKERKKEKRNRSENIYMTTHKYCYLLLDKKRNSSNFSFILNLPPCWMNCLGWIFNKYWTVNCLKKKTTTTTRYNF